MVRFHWPCDGGQNSFVPPGGVEQDEENGVTHINCEMELSGQNETCPALFTVPSNYLEDGSSVKSVGIVLGHGMDANTARGPFLTDLAVHFAKQGYVVMRYICKQKEQRRQRIFERSADTATFSPYARSVRKWVYVGHENGARIAALVGYKSTRAKHGFVLLSYPLLEPAPPPPKQKAGAEPPADSVAPLLRMAETCKAPILFINGEFDYNCPGADLKAQASALAAAGVDARAVIFPELDAHFRAPGASEAQSEALSGIKSHIEAFLKVVEEGNTSGWEAPRVAEIIPSTRVPPRPLNVPGNHEEGDQDQDDDEGEQGHGEEEAMEGVVTATAPMPALFAGGAGGVSKLIGLTTQQQQAMLMQQHLMQRAAAGNVPAAQQAQIQAQLQMAMLQQQVAAAAAAGAGGGAAVLMPMQQQQQQQQQEPGAGL